MVFARGFLTRLILIVARELCATNRLLYNFCDLNWRKTLNNLPIEQLQKQFQFLLSSCGPEKINALYVSGVIPPTYDLLLMAKQELERRNATLFPCVAGVMNAIIEMGLYMQAPVTPQNTTPQPPSSDQNWRERSEKNRQRALLIKNTKRAQGTTDSIDPQATLQLPSSNNDPRAQASSDTTPTTGKTLKDLSKVKRVLFPSPALEKTHQVTIPTSNRFTAFGSLLEDFSDDSDDDIIAGEIKNPKTTANKESPKKNTNIRAPGKITKSKKARRIFDSDEDDGFLSIDMTQDFQQPSTSGINSQKEKCLKKQTKRKTQKQEKSTTVNSQAGKKRKRDVPVSSKLTPVNSVDATSSQPSKKLKKLAHQIDTKQENGVTVIILDDSPQPPLLPSGVIDKKNKPKDKADVTKRRSGDTNKQEPKESKKSTFIPKVPKLVIKKLNINKQPKEKPKITSNVAVKKQINIPRATLSVENANTLDNTTVSPGPSQTTQGTSPENESKEKVGKDCLICSDEGRKELANSGEKLLCVTALTKFDTTPHKEPVSEYYTEEEMNEMATSIPCSQPEDTTSFFNPDSITPNDFSQLLNDMDGIQSGGGLASTSSKSPDKKTRNTSTTSSGSGSSSSSTSNSDTDSDFEMEGGNRGDGAGVNAEINDDEDDDDENVFTDPPQPPGVRFDIISSSKRYYKKYKTQGDRISIRVIPPTADENPVTHLRHAFRDLHHHVTHLSPNPERCKIGISFSGTSFARGDGGLYFRPVSELHFEELRNLIKKVTQSNAGFDINTGIDVTVYHVELPHGAGNNRVTANDVHSRSILKIDNKDNLCLPRSLVCALAFKIRGDIREGNLQTYWNKISRNDRGFQTSIANALVTSAEVTIPEAGCGMAEVYKFQEYYADSGVAIRIYNFETFGNGTPPMFDGVKILKDKAKDLKHTLNILFYENVEHFEPILILRGAVGTRHFCEICHKGISRVSHKCQRKCGRCNKPVACKFTTNRIKCSECNRAFLGQSCFNYHKSPNSYDSNKSVGELII